MRFESGRLFAPRGRARAALACLAVACSAGVGGCSTGYSTPSVTAYEVKGKVVLADGAPLTSGIVTFVPSKEGGAFATGQIGADGTFTLTTNNGTSGAAAGEYTVQIDPAADSAPTGKKAKPPFPVRYTSEGNSDLKVTVEPKPNDVVLQLKAK